MRDKQLTSRTAQVIAIASGGAAVVIGVLIFHTGVFWTGSVAQVHSACSAAGMFAETGRAATVCPEADVYALGMAGILLAVAVSAAFGVVAFVKRGNS